MSQMNAFVRSKLKDSAYLAKTMAKIESLYAAKPNSFNVYYGLKRFNGDKMSILSFATPGTVTFSYYSNKKAHLLAQNLNYEAAVAGVNGNLIEIEYLAGGTAGLEAVTVTVNKISVQIAVGVSTATQIKAAIDATPAAAALVNITVVGVASTPQIAYVANHLAFGESVVNYSFLLSNVAIVKKIRARKYVLKVNVLSIV